MDNEKRDSVEDRALAMAGELEPNREEDNAQDSSKVGVVNSAASVSMETGEIPAVGGDESLTITKAAEQVASKDGSSSQVDYTGQEENGTVKKTETLQDSDKEGEDKLLDDIDRLLAEDPVSDQGPEKSHNSVATTCVNVKVKAEKERELVCEAAATTGKENMSATEAGGGDRDEGDQLYLHAEDMIDEDEEFNRSLSGV